MPLYRCATCLTMLPSLDVVVPRQAFLAIVAAVVAVALGTGCQDPCVALAERICNCEATADQRRACIADRVTNQQGTVEVDDDDRDFCTDKLETCTCAALDQNDLASCGFAVVEE